MEQLSLATPTQPFGLTCCCQLAAEANMTEYTPKLQHNWLMQDSKCHIISLKNTAGAEFNVRRQTVLALLDILEVKQQSVQRALSISPQAYSLHGAMR